MTISEPPYFMKNPKWSYYDPRIEQTRLTDRATPKAIHSFVEFNFCNPMHFGTTIEYWKEQARKDIEEYKLNKHRYEFEIDQFGGYALSKIDGKEIH